MTKHKQRWMVKTVNDGSSGYSHLLSKKKARKLARQLLNTGDFTTIMMIREDKIALELGLRSYRFLMETGKFS